MGLKVSDKVKRLVEDIIGYEASIEVTWPDKKIIDDYTQLMEDLLRLLTNRLEFMYVLGNVGSTAFSVIRLDQCSVSQWMTDNEWICYVIGMMNYKRNI